MIKPSGFQMTAARINDDWVAFYLRYRLTKAMEIGIAPICDQWLKNFSIRHIEKRTEFFYQNGKMIGEYTYRLHCRSMLDDQEVLFVLTDSFDEKKKRWRWVLKDPTSLHRAIDDTTLEEEAASWLPICSLWGQKQQEHDACIQEALNAYSLLMKVESGVCDEEEGY